MRTLALAVSLALGLCAAPVTAATVQEANAMLLRAVNHVREKGKEKAFADFKDKSQPFIDGELYVFVLSLDGTCLAHGQVQKLVGQNLMELKDANGRKYIAEMVSEAKTKSSGFIDYLFLNPVTEKVEPKVSFWRRPEGEEFLLGVGLYRK